jgi:hypothetical protein
MQISSSLILLNFWDMMGWVKTIVGLATFFRPSHDGLLQPKKIGKIFIQIQVSVELCVSWAGLNLLLILPMWGDSNRSHYWYHQPNRAQPWIPVKKNNSKIWTTT